MVYNEFMKFFVLNGHKYYPYAEGKLNKTFFEEIVKILQKSGHQIKTTVVEKGYEIDAEIEKFQWADIVIFQTPMNWFSVPWVLKKYFDDVYRYGVFYEGSDEYGKGGLLKGKRYMFSMTLNPTPSDFNNPANFFEGKSFEDLIIALHKTQQYCGMEPIKTFCVYNAVHNPDVVNRLEELKNHINKYVLNK